jgi:hypothetical protein
MTLDNVFKAWALWLSGKVVKNEKINDIERTRVRSPPQATSLKNVFKAWTQSYDFEIYSYVQRQH